MAEQAVPRVFVSYSHDSPEHKAWVKELSSKLRREGGVRTRLDDWHLRVGEEMGRFMIEEMEAADFVLIVSTPEYVRKANEGVGGSGFEGSIATAALAKNVNTLKFIPIVTSSDGVAEIPNFVAGRKWIDLGGPEQVDEDAFQQLVDAIHGVASVYIPAVGVRAHRRGPRVIPDTRKQDIGEAVLSLLDEMPRSFIEHQNRDGSVDIKIKLLLNYAGQPYDGENLLCDFDDYEPVDASAQVPPNPTEDDIANAARKLQDSVDMQLSSIAMRKIDAP